jgi:hypothetical protein
MYRDGISKRVKISLRGRLQNPCNQVGLTCIDALRITVSHSKKTPTGFVCPAEFAIARKALFPLFLAKTGEYVPKMPLSLNKTKGF